MSVFQPTVNFTRNATAALLFVVGANWVLDAQLSIGTLVAFWQLLQQFFQPILDLAEKYNIMQAAMASSERVFRLLDTRSKHPRPQSPVVLPHVRGEIEFKNVSFAYNEGDWVLRDVDFTISAGESVAIVGATGAGKTSIISLISRFYDVQKGKILLDGVDLRDMKQADVRKHVGVVLQDPFIFAGTIASNIRLNETGIGDEQVRSAARFVNADKFIDRLPEGYETVVTERGSTLSVGQKQLLAFARAIAFNPEILLVLDEATSSVDTRPSTSSRTRWRSSCPAGPRSSSPTACRRSRTSTGSSCSTRAAWWRWARIATCSRSAASITACTSSSTARTRSDQGPSPVSPRARSGFGP